MVDIVPGDQASVGRVGQVTREAMILTSVAQVVTVTQVTIVMVGEETVDMSSGHQSEHNYHLERSIKFSHLN